MKNKLFASLLVSVLAIGGTAYGAITVSVKDFTSVSAGNPIVNASGVPAALNTVFASAGIFTSLPNFASATASQILALFTPIPGVNVSNTTFTGLFTGPNTSTLSAYPAGFDSAQTYMIVGNNATLANSTQIAVYSQPGVIFATPVAGIASTAINATTTGDWLYGTPTALTQQTTLTNSAFTTGIQLIASPVPETSTAVLGALGLLGLLRRRR